MLPLGSCLPPAMFRESLPPAVGRFRWLFILRPGVTKEAPGIEAPKALWGRGGGNLCQAIWLSLQGL
eukprot:6477323-Alexandrium_andersonii.AAC.1